MHTVLTWHGREMMMECKPAHDDVGLHYSSLSILNGLNSNGRNCVSRGIFTCVGSTPRPRSACDSAKGAPG